MITIDLSSIKLIYIMEKEEILNVLMHDVIMIFDNSDYAFNEDLNKNFFVNVYRKLCSHEIKSEESFGWLCTLCVSIKFDFAMFKCFIPIVKIVNYNAFVNKIYSRAEIANEFEYAKDLIPPLTAEEFYYALGLLDDFTIRNVLMYVGENRFYKLYDSYKKKDKTEFIDRMSNINIMKSLIIYVDLYFCKKMQQIFYEYNFSKDDEDAILDDEIEADAIFNAFLPSVSELFKIINSEDVGHFDIQNMVNKSNDALSEIKTLCEYMMSISQNLPQYLAKDANEFWQKNKFVFKDVPTQEKCFDNTLLIRLLIRFYVRLVYKYIQNEINKDNALQEENAQQNVEKENDDLSKNDISLQAERIIEPLGKSSLIGNELTGWLQEEENKDVPFGEIYRWILECLYDCLSGKKFITPLVINKSISGHFEDFVFILGGIMTDEEKSKISEEPTIEWNGPAYDMVAFIYAFCGYLSNIDKHLEPDPCNKSMAFLCMKTKKRYDKLSDQIRENNKTHMQRVRYWDNVIRACCKYAKDTFNKQDVNKAD